MPAIITTQLIKRTVYVDPGRKPQDVLDDTGRKLYFDDDVIETMPRGEREGEVTIHFFNVGRSISNDSLDREFERRNLQECDAYMLTAVNQAYPAFSDRHPNATRWKNGWWHGFELRCELVFYSERMRRRSIRIASARRTAHRWTPNWWFGGIQQ